MRDAVAPCPLISPQGPASHAYAASACPAAQPWRRLVAQQRRIDDLIRPRRHCIAVADIELHRATRLAEQTHEPDTQSAIACLFANLLNSDRRRVKHHAVIPGSPGESTVVCVAPGEAPTTPVTCTDVAVITGMVYDFSDGRLGSDTQPVVIELR